MKTWNVPAITELDIDATANGKFVPDEIDVVNKQFNEQGELIGQTGEYGKIEGSGPKVTVSQIQ